MKYRVNSSQDSEHIYISVMPPHLWQWWPHSILCLGEPRVTTLLLSLTPDTQPHTSWGTRYTRLIDKGHRDKAGPKGRGLKPRGLKDKVPWPRHKRLIENWPKCKGPKDKDQKDKRQGAYWEGALRQIQGASTVAKDKRLGIEGPKDKGPKEKGAKHKVTLDKGIWGPSWGSSRKSPARRT